MPFLYTTMELRQLKYIVAAAHALNISRAAKHLNVSQPAVSRMIRKLEAELDIKLFSRSPIGLSLTPSGEAFLDIARKILHDCEEAVDVLKSPFSTMKLEVGFVNTTLDLFLCDVLLKFLGLYPKIEMRIHDMPPGDQISALRSGKIDLAFLANLNLRMKGEFDLLSVKEVQLLAVLPGHHRLSRKKRVNLQDLTEETFLGFNEEKFPGYNQMISNACASAGFRPILIRKSDSLFEILGMVGAGMGICLMPGDVKVLSQSNVTFMTIENSIEPVRFVAAWLPGNLQIPLRNLVEYLREQ